MNCVLVLFDRLPGQRLSCYGNLRAATPAFDRLAATSVVFDQHIADLSAARDGAGGEASVGTTLTAPLAGHGVRVFDVADAPSQPNSALAAAVTAFDEIRHGDRWLLQVRCAGLSAEAAGENGSDWVGGIDAALGALLARIESSDVLLLVAGARGGSSPRPPVAEVLQPLLSERIQTPLFARLPQSRWGTRRQSLVALSDLEPTLAEWFGVAPETSQGAVSLLPLLRDEVRTPREKVVIRAPHAGAVRTAGWHFLAPITSAGDAPRVVTDEGLLFRKPEDAWDVLNVAPQHADVVDELSRLMERT